MSEPFVGYFSVDDLNGRGLPTIRIAEAEHKFQDDQYDLFVDMVCRLLFEIVEKAIERDGWMEGISQELLIDELLERGLLAEPVRTTAVVDVELGIRSAQYTTDKDYDHPTVIRDYRR